MSLFDVIVEPPPGHARKQKLRNILTNDYDLNYSTKFVETKIFKTIPEYIIFVYCWHAASLSRPYVKDTV